MSERGQLLLIACLVLAVVPNYWQQFFARTTLLILMISWLVSWLQRRAVHCNPEFQTQRVFAYARERVRLRIQNRGFLLIPLVGVKDETGSLHITGQTSASFDLPAFSQASIDYEFWNENRGVYSVGPTTVVGLDPLGLFPWKKTVPSRRTVIVYPRVSNLDLLAIAGFPGYSRLSQRAEHADPIEQRGLRPYEYGDSPRDIHWKASARVGSLIVRKPQLLQEVPLVLILNLRAADFHQKQKHSHAERCIEAAAAVGVFAANNNFDLSFQTNGQQSDAEFEYHEADIPRLLETLATIQLSETSASIADFFSNLHFQNQPNVLLIGPPLEPNELEGIAALRGAMRSLFWWVLDEQVERENRMGLNPAVIYHSIQTFKLYPYTDQLEFTSLGHE
jgi:uncharacterized protein (DUF58 family)